MTTMRIFPSSYFTLLAVIAACISSPVYAQIDSQDLQAVRTWTGDSNYQMRFFLTVDAPEELTNEFGIFESPYRYYKGTDGTGFGVTIDQHQVIKYTKYNPDQMLMGGTNSNYASLSWSYLQSHLPTSKLATLQPTSEPGVFAPVSSHGVIDWHNRVEVILNSDGTPRYVYVYNATAPLYTGAISLNLVQAKALAEQYMQNILPGEVTVTFSDMLATNNLIMAPDSLGIWQPVWQILMEAESGDEEVGCYVYVNAVDGSVFDDRDAWLGGIINSKPKYGKQIGFRILRDGQIIRTGKHTDVPIGWLHALAKGHKLSAKAGEKAFTLDGKRVALPAKVTAKAGTLYLPWQALKSLPGVKCSYDAKLNRLDITTAQAAAKAAAKPKSK